VRIKVADGKHGRFACPKCGQALLIKPPADAAGSPALAQRPAPTPQQPVDPLSDPLAIPHIPTEPASPNVGGFPTMPAAGVGAMPSRAGGGRPASGSPLKPFLIRLGIAHGVIAGVLLVLTLVGLLAEPVAMGVSLLAAFCAVGLLLAGYIWIVTIAFGETPGQGLLVLLVPYYWLVYVATRKGRAVHGLLVVLSALVPTLLSLLMLTVFSARYGFDISSGSGRRSRPLRMTQAQEETIAQRITEGRAGSPEADTLQTVSYSTFSQINGPIDPLKAEQVLSELPGYEPETFRHDAAGRRVAIQYRGPQEIAKFYGLYLAGKGKITMSMTAKFLDELPPNTAAVAPQTAAQPAALAKLAAPAAPAPPALQTVSFPTLSEAVDASKAEQVLSTSPGYIAGSFRFDAQQGTVTLQYRGTEAMATQYGLTLSSRAGIMVRVKPTFIKEAAVQ
jgi:hypothetical protein